jgi:thymidylate kinase
MVLAARALRRFESSARAESKPALRRGFWPIWALLLAQEKMQKLRVIERARERGAFVVCERYPQCEISGQSDGPLLDHWRQSSSRLLRALARWERRPYERARSSPPDLVVKLRVDERTALARRPGLAADDLRHRIRAVDQLSFGEGVATRVIDANQSLAAALAAIQIGVWSSI